MKYNYVLFDADETLFSFNAFAGLNKMLATYDSGFYRGRLCPLPKHQ